jgi:murein DD-endopeptidase MepM/ murein hydrolase activator NlpD
MPSVVELFRSWSYPRAIALTLVAVGAAGCSADSSRFTDNPYRGREVTGSVAQPAPVARVDSQPLPPAGQVAGGGYAQPNYNQPYNQQPTYRQPTPAPTYKSAAYDPPPPPAPRALPTRKWPQAGQQGGHWTLDGGTNVTVAYGDTIDSIAHRHGVPVSAIVQANNLAAPNAIQPGQRLMIPHYSRAPAVPTRTAARWGQPATTGSTPIVHVVAPGDTLMKISHRYRKPLVDIARANNIAPHARINIGDRIVIPGTHSASAPAPSAPALAKQEPAPAVSTTASVPSTPSTQTAAVVTPAAATPAPAGPVKSAEAMPGFRWPVRGRVIAGFGPATNGQHNDGINVAVPENTPIKAAEDGVVAYAGNELKGYGNLVLVRHPNGYVTAYAHAKELMVKRGDQIKRGQVIAKSGQTGNVDAPQVHFEIRKGPAPVDPMPFLNGA